MTSKVRALLGGAFTGWAAAITLAAASTSTPVPQKTTTNDGVYTKVQADRAKAQFEKICAECHPFTVAAKKKPKDLPLGDEPFFEQWTGRPLTELVTLIALTMPNDGSAVVTDEEALDLVAFILQQNDFPAGARPLTKETASAVVERPKK